MLDAPIPKPAIEPTVLKSCPNQRYIDETPRRPRPPTARPITAPPLYETRSAAGWPPFLAAIAVLPLAEVALLIPEYPAITEVNAPKRKAMEVSIPKSSLIWPPPRRRPATTRTKIARYRYSAYKNAIAPF